MEKEIYVCMKVDHERVGLLHSHQVVVLPIDILERLEAQHGVEIPPVRGVALVCWLDNHEMTYEQVDQLLWLDEEDVFSDEEEEEETGPAVELVETQPENLA